MQFGRQICYETYILSKKLREQNNFVFNRRRIVDDIAHSQVVQVDEIHAKMNPLMQQSNAHATNMTFRFSDAIINGTPTS